MLGTYNKLNNRTLLTLEQLKECYRYTPQSSAKQTVKNIVNYYTKRVPDTEFIKGIKSFNKTLETWNT